MDNNQFQSGYLAFEQGYKTLSELDIFDQKIWDDGNIAWSVGERRWRNAGANTSFSILFKEKWPGDGNVEGYVMEADLWRYSKDEDVLEELIVEREDNKFFYQKWTLHQKGKNKGNNNCFWKPVSLRLRSDLKIFNANHMDCIEVIQWEHRLHAFLNRGEVQG